MSIAHPFSNGSEFMLWDEENCCRCRKGYRDMEGNLENPDDPIAFDPGTGRVAFLCEIQAEIVHAMTGTPIAASIAKRWGYSPGDIFPPPCAEFERG